MALTQAHEEKHVLTEEQLTAKCALSFEEIINLPSIERAEVLEALYEEQARVKIKSTGKDDIQFSYQGGNSHLRSAPEVKYVIPGGSKDPAVIPLRAAVYVAVNRDYPQFGGSHTKMTGSAPDGRPFIEPVPSNPGLIRFELVRM